MQQDTTQQEQWATKNAVFVWKKLPDELPDCGEVAHQHEPPTYRDGVRLFMNGVAIGDYTVSEKKDCRVIFYTMSLLNAAGRVYGIVNAKTARALLIHYALTGHTPDGPPNPNQTMSTAGSQPDLSDIFGGFRG
jgi:hypothetical protein